MPSDITTERLHALVTDEWLDVETIMEQLIPTVAPGKAKRRYQRRSEAHRERYGQTRDETRVLSEDEQIASGARSILNERILSNVGTGRFELENVNGRRRIRLRPVTEGENEGEKVCPTCTRPFQRAVVKRTTTSTPRPQTKSNVIHVTFPRTKPSQVSESDASNG